MREPTSKFVQRMTPRERVLRALRREEPDRVPMWIQTGAYLNELVKKNAGADDPAEYLGLDIRGFVGRRGSRRAGDFSRYPSAAYAKECGDVKLSEWGIVPRRLDTPRRPPPMRNITTVDDLLEYPFPDIGAAYRYEGLADEVEAYHARGLPAVSMYECGTHEQCWALRRFDTWLMDLVSEPEFLSVLLEKVSDLKAECAARYAETGLDLLWIGDDLGTERAMMMSPATWRKHLKPCVAKIVAAAKKVNSNVLVAFHTDGYVEPVIADLAEVGVDVLQAVQPECMDPARLKNLFGDRIALWGTISVQQTMAHGTPQDVRDEVRKRIDTVGVGGGLLIAPSHTLEPPTQWENAVAFCEAVEEFGYY